MKEMSIISEFKKLYPPLSWKKILCVFTRGGKLATSKTFLEEKFQNIFFPKKYFPFLFSPDVY